MVHATKRKFKGGLKAIYAAQTIVSELDETVERNLDYLMSINTLTGYLLLCIDKPTESLEFIQIAERIAFKLIDKFQGHEKPFTSGTHEINQNQMTSLEVIGEAGK